MAIKELKSLTFGDGDTYVTTPLNYGNTLQWDGNTEGLFSMDGYMWRVSDAVVTAEDLANGIHVEYEVCSDGSCSVLCGLDDNMFAIENHSYYGFPIVIACDENGNMNDTIWFVPKGLPYWDENGNEIPLPEGVYFYRVDEELMGVPHLLTIPGFDKFHSSGTFKNELLPQALRFGEVPGESDTLEWDVTDNGHKTTIYHPTYESWSGDYYWGVGCFHKVSDNIITANDLANGVTAGFYDYGEIGQADCTFENGYIVQNDDGSITISVPDPNGNIVCGYAICCYPENSTYPPGVYFGGYSDFNYSTIEQYVCSLTIPGYGKFPAIKPIDKKYLPDDLGGMPEVTAEDNGKFLRVVDGVWAAASIPNAEGGGF